MSQWDEIDGSSLMKQSLLAKCVHNINQELGRDEQALLTKTIDYLIYFRANCTADVNKSKIDDFSCA